MTFPQTRRRQLLAVLIMLLMSACGGNGQKQKSAMNTSAKEKGKPNRLIDETSPYLLQHAYNPVDWHAWNAETLEKARREDKPLLISIGYAACHWCHVMERESFEDTVVAVKMNANYLPVKVDREERPDIDQIYMGAAMLITGQGGWPLNAIALPDGRPVFAATYFPRDRWIAVLDHFANLYKTDRGRLEEQARRVTAGIRDLEEVPFRQQGDGDFDRAALDTIWENWKPSVDFVHGGRKGAPKFMMPVNYDFLMRYYAVSQDQHVLEAVETGLTAMACGGVYDHAGGGFARYSVDDRWFAPHFEKMLYDNAQLVSVYAQAWQLTGRKTYRRVVYETLDFVDRELTDAGGGFYASLDADSEGEEGRYYTWESAELKKIWGDDYALMADYFQVTGEGNWESGRNILHIASEDTAFAEKHGLDAGAWQARVRSAKKQLLEVRLRRVPPSLDDKMLTSWNALMIKGYVDAYRAFGEKAWLERALRGARFLLENSQRADGGLNRNFKDGRSTINGFLDDYSFTIEAFIALYQATFEEDLLHRARALAAYAVEHFSDTGNHMFFYTSDLDDALIARKQEVQDNVIASSNSSMARALYYLGHYFYEDAYLDRARTMLTNVWPDVARSGPFFANWACLMTHFAEGLSEVAITGKGALELRRELDGHYLPNALFLGAKTSGSLELLRGKTGGEETLIYVCRDKSCKRPTPEVPEALSLIKN